MRTTIILSDELAARLQAQAHKEGKSFSAFLADAGRQALDMRQRRQRTPFRLVTFRGDGVHAGIDLDRTGDLVAAEDAESYGARTQ
jgi:predicted transcriptional regulator